MQPTIDTSTPLPQQSFLEPIITPVFQQWSHFRCGSYTADWVSFVMGQVNTSANFLLRGPVWFDFTRPIVPRAMMRLFKARGMTTEKLDLHAFSYEKKLHWIKQEIAEAKRPPVLLIKTATLHWIAVGGYDDAKELFYIYDPRIGDLSAGRDLPIGNAVMTYAELHRLWEGRWWWHYLALVVVATRA